MSHWMTWRIISNWIVPSTIARFRPIRERGLRSLAGRESPDPGRTGREWAACFASQDIVRRGV
jgi:hypothetical protein